MQSESLVRFHAEQNQPASDRGLDGASQRRAEIEKHVAEFQARGGEIQRIPSTLMARPLWAFSFPVQGQRQ